MRPGPRTRWEGALHPRPPACPAPCEPSTDTEGGWHSAWPDVGQRWGISLPPSPPSPRKQSSRIPHHFPCPLVLGAGESVCVCWGGFIISAPHSPLSAPARAWEFPPLCCWQDSFVLDKPRGPHKFSMKGVSPPTPRPLVMARKRETQPFPISSPAAEGTDVGRALGLFQSSPPLILHKENQSP